MGHIDIGPEVVTLQGSRGQLCLSTDGPEVTEAGQALVPGIEVLAEHARSFTQRCQLRAKLSRFRPALIKPFLGIRLGTPLP